MNKIHVETGKAYDVLVEKGISRQISKLIESEKYDKIAVITDEKVGKLYADKIASEVNAVAVLTFPCGEKHKTMDTVSDLLEKLARLKLTRGDLIVALGGGIVGDVAGFTAACFLRGIKFVQIPTTLLAMVDSSVGGKTGVNLTSGKNLAGAFHQPSAVLCDSEFLKTLPDEEIKNGLGEVIKYGCIEDKSLFETLEKGGLDNIDEIIARCVSIKADIVSRDEFDNGDRQKLNFGHTLGHAVEKATDFKIPHGQAVGIGMVLITRWAEEKGLTKKGCANRIQNLLEKLGMPYEIDVDIKSLWQITSNDKKKRGKKLTLVIIKDIGESYLYETDADKLL